MTRLTARQDFRFLTPEQIDADIAEAFAAADRAAPKPPVDAARLVGGNLPQTQRS